MRKTALVLAAAMLACTVSCSSKNGESVSSSDAPTSAQSTESGEKVNITIALAGSPNTWRGWQHIWQKVEELNSSDSPYTVEITRYEFDEDDYNGDTSMNRLTLDILAGKAPDVVSAAPFQLDKLSRNGYLTDLSPLMESGTGMTKEDFLDSVTDSVEKDGEINVIYPAFEVHTAAAKTELVGDKENWTIDDAISAYNSFNGDFLADMYTKYDIRHYFFYGAMMNCIDFNAHTCDFDSSLAPVLDFLTGLPPMEKRLGDNTAIIGQIHDNTALVKEQWINGINQSYASEVLRTFGNEPMTFVGYPTNNGRGSYTEISGGFGIMANSNHKDEAWGAVSELFFSDEFQREISDYGYGVPVRRSTFESLLSRSEYEQNAENLPAETADTGGKSNEMKTLVSAFECPDGSEKSLSDAQIQQLSDFLSSLKIEPFVDPSMEHIIKEESDYVFEGERSVQQCVEILQNRIGLYLSETE